MNSEQQQNGAVVVDITRPQDQPSTAIARPSARQVTMAQSFQGLMPQSIGEAMQIADFLAKSKAIPAALQGNPASVFTVMMTGIEVGLTPLQAVNNIFVISGNVGMKGNLQLALVRKSGLMVHWDEGWDTSDADPEQHFGWCEVARKDDLDFRTGQQMIRRKTFSRADARKVMTREWQDRNPVDVPLAEKNTYQNWPERMYPMRARTWILEQVFGDVLKGIAAVESLESGQVLDAEVVMAHGDADGADDILAKIRAEHGDETATAIESGFDLLKLPPARRLQKLTQFRSKPADLVEDLRNEWGRRSGRGDVGTAKADAARAANLEGGAPPAETKPTQADTKPATADTKAADSGPIPFGGDPVAADDVDDAIPTIDAAKLAPAVTPAQVEADAAKAGGRVQWVDEQPAAPQTPAQRAAARTRRAFKPGDTL